MFVPIIAPVSKSKRYHFDIDVDLITGYRTLFYLPLVEGVEVGAVGDAGVGAGVVGVGGGVRVGSEARVAGVVTRRVQQRRAAGVLDDLGGGRSQDDEHQQQLKAEKCCLD